MLNKSENNTSPRTENNDATNEITTCGLNPQLSPGRNISIVMAVAAGIAALAGTFFADGSIVVHWSGSGEPNDSAGKWVLWVMLLLAVLSLFSYSSFLKHRPGFQTPIGREMACGANV